MSADAAVTGGGHWLAWVLVLSACCLWQTAATHDHPATRPSQPRGGGPPSRHTARKQDASPAAGHHSCPEDSARIVTRAGDSVMLNCHADSESRQQLHHLIQWRKQGLQDFVYISSPHHPTYVGGSYRGRLTAAAPGDAADDPLVNASISLSDVQLTDQGCYECTVKFMTYQEKSTDVTTWVSLHVKGHTARILGEPELFIAKGRMLNLTCIVEAKMEDPTKVTWYHDGQPLVGESPRHRVSVAAQRGRPTVSRLRLDAVQPADSGTFSCRPAAGTGADIRVSVISVSPRFKVTPGDVRVTRLGAPLTLHCAATGAPTPKIHWFKDNRRVSTSPTVGLFRWGTELRISSVRLTDLGKYRCSATNSVGRVETVTTVIAEGPAVISVPPYNQTVAEGQSVQLSCKAIGVPANVSVTWYKDGEPLQEDGYLQSRARVLQNGSLDIQPVTGYDTGVYTCRASNGVGQPQGASAFLDVHYPARVDRTPQKQYLPTRRDGVVVCPVRANPGLSSVMWQKDGKELAVVEGGRIQLSQNGSLLIRQVSREDAGVYMCTPYNALGTVGGSDLMPVSVGGPPVFVTSPLAHYHGRVGQEIKMACSATGEPKPTLIWKKVGSLPLPRRHARFTPRTLTLSHLTPADAGMYECVARNEVSAVTAATQLHVTESGPGVEEVAVHATTDSIQLQWAVASMPAGGHSPAVLIRYRPVGSDTWETIPNIPAASGHAIIRDLDPQTSHEVQVWLRDAAGPVSVHNITVTTKTAARHRVKKSACPRHLLDLDGRCYFFSYRFHNLRATWWEAAVLCKQLGLELTAVETARENSRIRRQLLRAERRAKRKRRHIGTTHWIGGFDLMYPAAAAASNVGRARVWSWLATGLQVRYTSWHEVPADNWQHCAQLAAEHGFRWAAADCSRREHFICEDVPCKELQLNRVSPRQLRRQLQRRGLLQ